MQIKLLFCILGFEIVVACGNKWSTQKDFYLSGLPWADIVFDATTKTDFQLVINRSWKWNVASSVFKLIQNFLSEYLT